MALPMQSTPTFNLKIPSSGKTVKFRPFVVKEEKALLIAQQSEDQKVMVDTLKSVLASCLLDQVDVNELAIFDLEYMFLQIRGKSVGETVDLFFACDTDHGEQNEKAKQKITLKLSEIEVTRPEGHTNKIPLFGEVGVVMKYPTLSEAEDISDFEDWLNQNLTRDRAKYTTNGWWPRLYLSDDNDLVLLKLTWSEKINNLCIVYTFDELESKP